MKTDHRSKTSSFSLPLRKHRRLALFLGLLTALSVLTVSAAATCNFLLKWGTTGNGHSEFTTPRGIAVDPSGNVYVSDSNTRVQKFDSSGTFILQFGVPGVVNGGFVLRWQRTRPAMFMCLMLMKTPVGCRSSTPVAFFNLCLAVRGGPMASFSTWLQA